MTRPQAPRRRWLAIAGTLAALLAALGFAGGAEQPSQPTATAPEEDQDPPGAEAPERAASLGDHSEELGASAGRPGVDDAAPEATTAPGGDEAGDEHAAAQPIGDPKRIEIPAIGVDAEIVPVGLKDDGAMEVPDFGLAGWYTEGPRPGEEGPSTVVAHVDSRAGPDVFARLRELDPGDEVRVRGDDGTVTYVVDSSESAPKDELPTERIWGRTPEPTLRLITCGGRFDRSSGHYEDNVIVYLSVRV